MKTLRMVFGGMVVLGVIFLLGVRAYNKATVERQAAAVQQQQNVPIPAWGFRTFNPLPAEGVTVYLIHGWGSFPLGGPVMVTTPNGTVVKDRPGVDLKPTPLQLRSIQLEGWYTFRADPPGSMRGVRIYNRW